MHPSRIDTDTDDFTTIGKSCLTRALLENKRRFFTNSEEVAFTKGGEDYDMMLSDRERAIVLLDEKYDVEKRFYFSP